MNRNQIASFLTESLLIERIKRTPFELEMNETIGFLQNPAINLDTLVQLQAVYQPGAPLREKVGMDVLVGTYKPPVGGMMVRGALGNLLWRISQGADPWCSHIEFEELHPFMDGNGRVGRTLWAWNMWRVMRDPFQGSFLEQWYLESFIGARKLR